MTDRSAGIGRSGERRQPSPGHTRREFLQAAIAAGLVGGSQAAGAAEFAHDSDAQCLEPSLPQHDRRPFRRRLRLGLERSRYDYNYDYLPGVAMVDCVPVNHLASFPWLNQVVSRIIRTGINGRLANGSDYANARPAVMREIVDGLTQAGGQQATVARLLANALASADTSSSRMTPRMTLESYADLFRIVPLPAIAADFMDDEVFAWQRLAGANPVWLRRIAGPDARFPVDEAIYESVLPNDSLAAAGAEGRLYLLDYADLHRVETGIENGLQKYLSAPLALFAVAPGGGPLTPIAIQCAQTPGPDNPVFTPHDGYAWLMAKTIVQTADANVHEAVTHLGHTHLLVEPFVLASERQLASNHPIGMLLRPHFEGTLFINDLAQLYLIAPGGPVDHLLGGTIEASRAVAGRAVADYGLKQAALPEALRERGVDDASVLPDYPYRDDALLYWDVIESWVHDYVHTYYATSQEVAHDPELMAWCRELGESGHVPGFRDGEVIQSRTALVDALTSVIFTASVQHAAVNFPQYDHMVYAPNMPLAGFAPAPVSANGVDEQDYLDLLPPRQAALGQLDILYLLGTLHHTTLGEYGDALCDPAIQGPLADFRRRLDEVGDLIEARNRERRPYTFLERGGIPQSTNI